MRTYTKEARQNAIDRFISGESAADILTDTGIPKSTFYNWVHIYQEEKKALNKRTVNIRNFHLLENKVVLDFIIKTPLTPNLRVQISMVSLAVFAYEFELSRCAKVPIITVISYH